MLKNKRKKYWRDGGTRETENAGSKSDWKWKRWKKFMSKKKVIEISELKKEILEDVKERRIDR